MMDLKIENPVVITALLATSFSYLLYCFFYIRHKPHFIAKEGSVAEFFLKHCPIVTDFFSPTPWCFTGRSQTCLRPLFKSSPKVTYTREDVKMADEGEIHLDWHQNENSEDVEDRPIVVLMPGLTGCSCANYLKFIVIHLAEKGYKVCVFNNRGTCSSVIKTPKMFCAAYISDADQVFQHIKKNNPNSPMAAIGISLGGMILCNYLSSISEASQCPISAALIVSVVWDPSYSAEHMEKPLDWFLFNRVLTNYLVRMVKRNGDVLSEVVDVDKVLQARTIKQFDKALTVQMFGYEDVEDYYKSTYLPPKLNNIQVPLLCLAAEDDPFVPFHTVPVTEIAQTDNVAMVVTKHGGHIGFLEGWFPRHRSYLDRLACQFAQAVFEHHAELQRCRARVSLVHVST